MICGYQSSPDVTRGTSQTDTPKIQISENKFAFDRLSCNTISTVVGTVAVEKSTAQTWTPMLHNDNMSVTSQTDLQFHFSLSNHDFTPGFLIEKIGE